MNKIILFIIVLLMSISFAAAFPVDITYSDSSADGKNIVADVPFDVTVYMNTNNNDVLSYNLHVASTDSRALFTSASRGILFLQNDLDANSGPQSSNTIYRYQVKPKVGYAGNSADRAVSIFSLRTKIPGIAPSTIELKRDGMASHADNIITPAVTGANVDAINDILHTITPQISECGDGVVGYTDINRNGAWDTLPEVQEACDEGVDSDGNNKNTADGGCSATCDYIELGYSCTNTNFGDRVSSCTVLPPREFLIQKLTALIEGQCYPDCNHPAALYKGQDPLGNPTTTPHLTYTNGKLDPSEKIYMITQIGVALREFFTQTVQTPAAS